MCNSEKNTNMHLQAGLSVASGFEKGVRIFREYEKLEDLWIVGAVTVWLCIYRFLDLVLLHNQNLQDSSKISHLLDKQNYRFAVQL